MKKAKTILKSIRNKVIKVKVPRTRVVGKLRTPRPRAKIRG